MSEIIVPTNNWRPREYQMPLWSYLEGGGKRAVAVWHRRGGKDATALNWTVVSSFKRAGLYWHLLPTYNQGRKIVWDGRTREGVPFLNAFPEEAIANKNDTDMRLKLRNNSIWQVVGTDNVDRLVGTNVVGAVFSEYSLQDPRAWDMIRPILAENGGWALFIYTARGRNHGYTMYKNALGNPKWFSQLLSVEMTKRPDGTPVITKEAIDDDRMAGMPEELVQQEYYCSFDAALVGAYYGKEMNKAALDGRICHVPYDPSLEVHTAWDLGMDDSMSIWFFQRRGFEVRMIDYYENSGEGFPHYAQILKAKEYVYGEHIAPHDITVRELGTGKSRFEAARGLGIRFRIAKKLSLEDGINACRLVIPMCYFDETKCERGIDGMRQYRKEWDDDRKVFRSSPADDWTRHPSDAFRTMAVGIRAQLRSTKSYFQMPRVAQNQYDIFG